MKLVAILGSKGGTGKTTLAHTLSYGATLAGHPTTLVHTDQRPPVKGGRPYEYVDCSRNYAQITKLIKDRADQDGFLIIDGAGNRPHLDIWLTGSMDLVLVPVTNSAEDVRCALQDLARFDDPRVRVVVNRWPANRLVRMVMQRYVNELPDSRIAGLLPEVGGVRVFLEDRDWETPGTKVNNQARRMFRLVEQNLDTVAAMPPFDKNAGVTRVSAP